MTRLINLSNTDMESDYSLQGYDARDASGDKLGGVDSVIADGDSMRPVYLVVDTGGWFSSKQFVVPIGDVNRVDDENHDVYFTNLSKDTLESRYPRYDDQWWNGNNHAAFATYEQGVANAYGRSSDGNAAVDYSSELYTRRPQNTQRLQLMEERLQANKERYQAGAVKLGKRVIEHTETLNVPVREERVVIERTPVSGATPAHGEIDGDQTIEVPVMKERVQVETQPFVREEVGVRTEAVETNQQVQGTVRREELDVQDGEELMSRRDSTLSTREGATPNRTASGTAANSADYVPERPMPTEPGMTDSEAARRNR